METQLVEACRGSALPNTELVLVPSLISKEGGSSEVNLVLETWAEKTSTIMTKDHKMKKTHKALINNP